MTGACLGVTCQNFQFVRVTERVPHISLVIACREALEKIVLANYSSQDQDSKDASIDEMQNER
jgi:hypothetical protein